MDNRSMEAAVQVLSSVSSTSSTESSPSATETVGSSRTALIIDGSYAMIGARSLVRRAWNSNGKYFLYSFDCVNLTMAAIATYKGGKIDYVKLRAALEEQALTQFGDCWYFDQNPSAQRLNPAITVEYNRLKFAPPDGPQIVDRFVLFAGDGDFYSSLSHVRNVLRKDIWVMGYRGTVSGDLQQLASRVLWMNDLWLQVKSMRHLNHHEQGGKDERQKHDGCRDEVRWFEDHKGEDFQLSNDSALPLNDAQNVGSSRHIVIGPRSNHRGRGRDWRLNGRDRGKSGRRRSRSRSRDRPRRDQHCGEVASTHAVFDADAATHFQSGAAMKKRNSKAGGKRVREWGSKNGKRRKRSDTADKSERKRPKRGGHWDKQAANFPVSTLSDISSDEDTGKPPLPATVAPGTIAQGHDYSGVDEIINLASDTDSD